MESMATTPVKKALFSAVEVNYRFNPTSADVTKTTWKFINNSAKITTPGKVRQYAPGDGTDMFEVPTYTSNNDGSGKFTLKIKMINFIS